MTTTNVNHSNTLHKNLPRQNSRSSKSTMETRKLGFNKHKNKGKKMENAIVPG
jgi:hypothetical protein